MERGRDEIFVFFVVKIMICINFVLVFFIYVIIGYSSG